jgi:hypothetical protein
MRRAEDKRCRITFPVRRAMAGPPMLASHQFPCLAPPNPNPPKAPHA